jgi:8-oxo-dGTP diphosphatase
MDYAGAVDRYPLSVDSVIFGYTEGEFKIALVKRKKEPYLGMWALPGGFMEGDENLEETALRELKEETGIANVYLEEFGVFSQRSCLVACLRPSRSCI